MEKGFTQLGKYGRHGEQCYRQNFGRLRSKSLNWLRFNVSLALRYFGSDGRKARDTNKLGCAFNASFASLNVAKVMMKEREMQYSMSNFKLLMTNTFLTKRIFDNTLPI